MNWRVKDKINPFYPKVVLDSILSQTQQSELAQAG